MLGDIVQRFLYGTINCDLDFLTESIHLARKSQFGLDSRVLAQLSYLLANGGEQAHFLQDARGKPGDDTAQIADGVVQHQERLLDLATEFMVGALRKKAAKKQPKHH